MKFSVDVQGLKELDDALGELPKSVGLAVLRRIAKKALGIFDRVWRATAPHLTGALARSGGIGTKLTRRQAQLNRKRDDRSSIEMFSGPNDPAAVPQEFGTVDEPAQPYMRPAWDATQDLVLASVREELGGEIQKTAKRLEAKAARLLLKG